MCKFLLLFRRWGATRKVAFFFSYSCRCLLSFRLVFSPETFFQIFNLMAQTWIDGKKFAAFVIRKKNSSLTCTIAVSTENFSCWGSQNGTRERRRWNSFRRVMWITRRRRSWTIQGTDHTRLFVGRWWIDDDCRWLTRRRCACDDCGRCGDIWRCDRR